MESPDRYEHGPWLIYVGIIFICSVRLGSLSTRRIDVTALNFMDMYMAVFLMNGMISLTITFLNYSVPKSVKYLILEAICVGIVS